MELQTNVIDVSAQSFQSEVVAKSRDVPVVILFWAEQIEAAATMRELCVGLAASYEGKFLLGLSDVSADPMMAQQLRIQNIPSVRVIQDGRLTEQLDGPQGESVVRQLLDRLTMSSGEVLQQDLTTLVENENWDQALALLQESINEEPNNPAFKVEWADILALKGDLAGAKEVLGMLGEDVADRQRPALRVEMIEEVATYEETAVLQRSVDSDATDLESAYRLAIRLTIARRYRDALELALGIVRKDRSFRDDLGRQTVIRIIALLGKSSELAQEYRRKMFAFLH